MEPEKVVPYFGTVLNGAEGEYVDLFSGQEKPGTGIDVPAYGFYYLKKK